MHVQVNHHPGFISDLWVDGERLAGVDPAVGEVIEALVNAHALCAGACAAAMAFLSSLAEYRHDDKKPYGYFEIVSVDNARFDALLTTLRMATNGTTGS